MFSKKQEKERGLGKARAHIFVSGRVQGVLFRKNTKRQADKLGIFGWVKNLSDGRLEAVFEGDKPSIEKIINWARRGPFWAQVKSLRVILEDYQGQFAGFEIKQNV